MTKESDQDGDAMASKNRADPVAARSEDLTHAGGTLSGEPGAGGAGFGSGTPQKGSAKPSGDGAKSEAPISNDVAPIVHTAMDGDVKAVEERAHRTTRPGAGG